ncbi:MAG: translocation/assembly module TamB domain-containing protein [Bacteroidales bacterium]|nr:translocation/assembly module TamB domain-containing protein [Bacteroidales bacterium]
MADDNKTIHPAPGQQPESEGAPAPAGKAKRHLIRPRWLRIVCKTLLWLVVAILLIPVLLYIPPVQTLVKNVACKAVYNSTGMKIGIEKFRLKWPVDVSLQGVSVIEASGDTMAVVREAVADVRLVPLLNLDVQIKRLDLNDGYYRMVSPDSSMILKIRAGLLSVDDRSSADLRDMRILLHKARIKDGDVSLFMDVWRQRPSAPDTTATPIFISADDLQLENFTFGMSMLPTIDTLRLHARSLSLRKGVVDLGRNMITARSLAATQGDVVYLTPDTAYIKSHPLPEAAPDSTSVPASPMVIRGDSVSLSAFKALYAVKGGQPMPGFDPSYIEVDGVEILLKDFYNAASVISLPIVSVKAKERSGLEITEGSGVFAMDSTGMNLRDFFVKTPYSTLQATAGLPNALLELRPEAPVAVNASGSLGIPDIEAFMPSLKYFTSSLSGRAPLSLAVEASGILDDVDIPRLDAAMPGIFSLKASGKARNAMDFKRINADIRFDGSLVNPSVVDNLLGGAGFKMPSFTLKGRASAAAQTYSAAFSLLTSAGDLTADGRVSLTSEAYNADLSLRQVNVAHFMPTLGVGPVTATLHARGNGFNPERPRAATDISLDVASLDYNSRTLRDIKADITLHDGVYDINAVSRNDAAYFNIEGSGTVADDLYTFDLAGTLDRLDLHALGITPDVNYGSGGISLKGSASPKKWIYDVAVHADSLEWTSGNQYFSVPGDLALRFNSYADRVRARADASLTCMEFNSSTGLKSLVDAFALTADSLAVQMERRNINVETLQAAMPPFRLDINASGRGVVGKYLNTMGLRMDTLFADISNDSLIAARIGLYEIANNSMRADTVRLDMRQRGKLLDYRAHMGNRRNNPTLAEFADVNLNGYLGENRGLISLTQRNQKGDTGYRLGMTAALADSVINIHFTPRKATIAYLPWNFNMDNHVDFNINNMRINANLMAESNESSIKLQTVTGKRGNDELTVNIDNLKVQDFLRMSVFAPPLTASVDADLRVGYTEKWLYGGGDVGISDFTYDKLRVGDMNLKLGAAMNDDGTSAARAALKIDGNEALTAVVRLKPDSVTKEMTPRKVTLGLKRFPLYVANAFLGPDVACLSGYLTGNLDMKGNFTAPVLNGAIGCDSVGVFLPMLGSGLRFDNDSVSLADNILHFNDFNIWGANRNPLVVSGDIDATKFSDVRFDLGLKAKDFMLINNDKRSHSEIYGKLMLDLTASARGPMQHFNINADVNVLGSTDVTYSVPQTTAELRQQDAGEVVKFVNFSDTAKVEIVDSVAPMLAMRIVAGLTIQPGAVINVEIPGTATTGSGKVQINPSGTLNYFQNYMGDMRLNGQLDLGDGYARYNVPLMGEKKFVLKPSSYVLWNGDLMNPTLSISATDLVKANLLQDGNTRIVNFLVQLNVGNTLSAPKVLFDLSTDDDMTIQNDLLSMSSDQRSMAAINLLLTGQYNQQGVKTPSSDLLSSSVLTGKLYGMLTGQLNSWLANNVRGVDLSFGVDQYDKTVNGESGTATSYSYSMSKSLFNNRFKISVGGNYTTDASADENFSENLINDISFEYILKQSAGTTMYLRLFRHTGYESILEGEITETGGGFVLKRRLSTLRDLFNWARRKREDAEPADSTAAPADTKAAPADSVTTKPSTEHEENH